MAWFNPSSFLEALAASCLAVALLLATISLVPPLRSHSTRLFGMFIVVGLALFANAWSTYFSVIFIIATVVTELAFLETLVAILRGSDAYFKYRKEYLTPEESARKITTEQVAIGGASVQASTLPASEVDQGLLIEQLAIQRLEKDLGARIERGVRFSKDGRTVEVDGIARGDRLGRDQIVEIRWIRQGDAQRLINRIPSLLRVVLDYREVTSRDAYLVLVAVVPTRDAATETTHRALHDRLRETRENWSLYLYSYQDIGLPAD